MIHRLYAHKVELRMVVVLCPIILAALVVVVLPSSPPLLVPNNNQIIEPNWEERMKNIMKNSDKQAPKRKLFLAAIYI